MLGKFVRKVCSYKNWRLMQARGLYYSAYIRACGGRVGKGLLVEKGFTLKHPPHSGIVIGTNVMIGRNVVFDVPLSGALNIGDRVKFTMFVVIAAQESVSIGECVQIAEFTSVRDSDHGIEDNGILICDQNMISRPIEIGRDVWLARGVAVLKGSVIGDGAVIGANTVIPGKVVKQKEIVVGSGPRVIRERSLCL